MRYYQDNSDRYQRRRRRVIIFLLPLVFLLIFVFSQSFTGLLISLGIIAILWALIAATWISSRMWDSQPGQQSPYQQPAVPVYTPPQAEVEPTYEQGYRGEASPAWQQQPSYQYQEPGASAESDRLEQLKLLGDLHASGVLSDEEFESQKQRILQSDATQNEAAKGVAPSMSADARYEEQPQAQYEQEQPPMSH
jgi:hypothetical protein